jgi:hypothetical protein
MATLTLNQKLDILEPHVANFHAMQSQKDVWQQACLAQIEGIPPTERAVFVVNGDRRCGKSTLAKKLATKRPDALILCLSHRSIVPGYRMIRWDRYFFDAGDQTLILDGYDHMNMDAEKLQVLTAGAHILVLLGDDRAEPDFRAYLQRVATHVFNVREHIDQSLIPEGLTISPWTAYVDEEPQEMKEIGAPHNK